MLKPTKIASKTPSRAVFAISQRFNSTDMATRNNYYNEYWDRGKKSQWDGGEDITDKDRHREMYFDWAQETNRGIHPTRYGNVGNARRHYKNVGWGEQMEFQRIMRSICQGNYMNLTEEQMRAANLGYMSEDDDFLTREEDDYGVPYYKANVIYRNQALVDRCEGRPTYEWQIPAGADRYYGYKTVSTAVDVNYTDAINENDVYDWETTTEQIPMKGTHYILYNRTTDSKILICSMEDTKEAIDKFDGVDTCALMLAADTLLSSMDSPLSPLSRNDTELLQIGIGWSVFAYCAMTSVPVCWSIYGATAFQFLRTYFQPYHMRMKTIMKACREKELHVVFGDWLGPDLVERELHTSDQDITAIAERYNMFAMGNDSANGEFLIEGNTLKANWYKFLIDLELRGILNSRKTKISTLDQFEAEGYPKTYAEAIQDKRLDLLAHTVNNMETNRAVVGVQSTRDVSTEVVAQLLKARLTSDVPVSVPLEYMEDHERVSVVWQ